MIEGPWFSPTLRRCGIVAAVLPFGMCFDSASVVGTGNVVSETREVSGFRAIRLVGAAQLVVEQTGDESLTVTSDDNLQPHLTSTVVDGMLELASEVSIQSGTRRYHVTVKELNRLEIDGANAVEVYDLDTERFDVTVEGANAVLVTGIARAQFITVSGASAYDAEALASENATVIVAGASAVVVRVSDRLEATVTDASEVVYVGDPAVIVHGPAERVRRR